MAAVSRLLPGQFAIRPIRPLGEGGLGVVDEVEVIATNQSHAVGTRLARKRLGAQWANDSGAQARFEREISMLRTMQHPSIVSLEGVSLPGGERWYVMPLFRRGSLRAALANVREAWPNAVDVARFVATVSDALAYAHGMNFIHRDMKPENILISDDGKPVVADWGLGQFVHLHSKVLDLTRGGPMGTHYYCSFEQWTTGRCEATGDVYSLGMVLAEMLAGRAIPVSAVGIGIRVDVLDWTGPQATHLNNLVRAMTSLSPLARPQSMALVTAGLRAVV